MAIDMGQFVQTFFEESLEGLDVMEAGLLELQPGGADQELINTIFRAAHSIKGGSGTFGYRQVSDFTHVMETLLDGMRDGRFEVTGTAVDTLLAAVDCLREMLAAARAGGELDSEQVHELRAKLAELADTKIAGKPVSAEVQVDSHSGWSIKFRPYRQLMHNGNDPVRLFRELETLGELTVKVDTSQLPSLEELKPEDCYLAWDIELRGDIARQAVEEVFVWVEDDCELELNPLPVAVAQEVVVANNEEGQQGELLVERRSGGDRRKGDRRMGVSSLESGSIRVGIDKVDAVINLVGELVTTQSMLSALGEDFEMGRLDKLHEALDQLERNTRDLQEHVMQIRMLPVSAVFSRFPRMVHDLSQKLGKMIELQIMGEQTELDKTMIEKIGDPLVHLIRNSLDHGIEPPEERRQIGKPDTGVVCLNAYHKGGNIYIEVSDDGRGLNRDKIFQKGIETGLVQPGEELSDEQVYELIFHPGFSLANQVSDVSGRGVGMDVVRRNIHDVGGSIQIRSRPGSGTTFTICLPLTLAILDGQLVTVGKDCYIIPLLSIIESVQIRREAVNRVAGKGEVFHFRDRHLPIIRLYELFGTEQAISELEQGLLVVVEADGRQVGLFVDDLLGQQQVSIKSLEKNFRRVEGVSGATILGDGRVALILDIAGLIRMVNPN